MNQSKSVQSIWSRHEAQENICERVVTIGYGFTSNWLRKWLEFFKPITERSNEGPKQIKRESLLTFQVKTALKPVIKAHQEFLIGLTIWNSSARGHEMRCIICTACQDQLKKETKGLANLITGRRNITRVLKICKTLYFWHTLHW